MAAIMVNDRSRFFIFIRMSVTEHESFDEGFDRLIVTSIFVFFREDSTAAFVHFKGHMRHFFIHEWIRVDETISFHGRTVVAWFFFVNIRGSLVGPFALSFYMETGVWGLFRPGASWVL